MFVFVVNKDGKPLMPCKPVVARLLLKEGKARVLRREPFTIKMLVETDSYTQPVVAGMDTGSKKVGCAAIANGKVIYAAEVTLRTNISKKLKQRAAYRRNRRGRKTRYRPARWRNRASMRRDGRLAPSVKSKLDSHLREKRFVESILPVSKWIVETANFDIHKITNPGVSGRGYQQGAQQGIENLKAYILSRDDYKCQRKGGGIKHSQRLHVHHIIWRSQEGTDTPDNLVVLCEDCHEALHRGEWQLPERRSSKTRHATQIGVIQARLKASGWNFQETFGYLTKLKRRELGLPKSHANDAIAICGAGNGILTTIFYKRHVAAGDYQQTKGKRSEVRIPTGKLFGLRKFDLIRTAKGIGFVKGKRSSGYFSIMDIAGKSISNSVNVKKKCGRLAARTTTLTQQGGGTSSSA